ncbi:MAG: SbcC/MukB-like Walker B domain-containing protein [Actinomycetota bacterium]
MAGELRGTLAIGEPCPVCARSVATLPPAAKAPAIRTAQRAVDAAAKALTKAEAGRDAARAASAAADGRHVAAQERATAAGAALRNAEDDVRAAEATLGATQSEVVDRLGQGDPKALLDERERELRDADARLRSAAAAAAVARNSLDAARRDAAEAAAALSGLTARLAGSWGLLGESRTPATTTEEIRDAFGELVSVLAGRHEEAAAAKEQARAALSEAEAGLAAQLQALGLGRDGDFTDASAAARAERAAADERLLRLEQLLADGEDLDRRLMKASEDLALIRRLRDELQPSRFLAWLLAEERAALAELGSVHLEELTAGGFRFTGDDSFRILDLHAGDAERSPDSLSGGETFLASLALALALAEMVARGGGRLDAFFLDEGFGSLDADHIERAMDGIGRLVASGEGRLVVLVSHVDLMRQMIEDLIVLEKDERTGQTVVVSGAARDTG